MNMGMNRREALRAGMLAGAAGLMLGGRALALGRNESAEQPQGPGVVIPRKRVLRLAHITDMHIQPERGAFEGVGMCLRHLQGLSDKPALVLTGGDLIMDSFEHDAARTTTLWDLWSKTLKDHCGLPVEHCIGNHDIWGWNKKKSATTGEEAKWGKRWAMDVMGLAKPYRSFDKAGWRFVVLDSVFPNGDGYIGRLDDEQFAWLEALLKETPAAMPVLVLSHIPILTITSITKPKEDVVKAHEGSISEMMSDMPRIVKLFDRHRNVKTCLSGHIHELDRVDYQGVTYFCNGAVSGAWWKGKHNDCDEGYALVDLYDDGSVERVYQTYGWKAKE
jgi:3',5'-cyclic AMP phosphodiesterase CpdA